MKIIGLTGGIGSGKSTVARFFAELGAPIYIADDEAKKIMETSKIIREEIKVLLGEEAYQGEKPDRGWIASKVFQEDSLLQALNKIVHPRVREHFEAWTKRQNAAYVIYEAAVLFENGGDKNCDYTILVTAPKETRIERLLKRDRSTRKEIEARMAAQWSDKRKSKLADFQIENLLLEQTKEAVVALHQKLLGL